MKKIKIVDVCMGGYKSTAAINFMNANRDKHFLYVAPYLDELRRIHEHCPFVVALADNDTLGDREDEVTDFSLDLDNLPKMAALIDCIKKGKSVAITHSLFKDITNTLYNKLKEKNYILIHDEEPTVLYTINISKEDKCLLKGVDPDNETEIINSNPLVKVENGTIVWQRNRYSGKFNNEMKRIKQTKIIEDGQYWYWTLDPALLESFSECYILTYRFKYSLFACYLKKNGFDYEYYHIDGDGETASFVRGFAPTSDERRATIRACINVCQNERWNSIGETDDALSKEWFKNALRAGTPEDNGVSTLYKYAFAFLRSGNTSKSKWLWACFKGYSNPNAQYMHRELKSLNGQIPVNCRASNKYGERTRFAYLVNFNLPLTVYNALDANTKAIRDGYTLNTLLQCVWRSAIRNNEKIEVYIPSKRMRELFEGWLQSDF